MQYLRTLALLLLDEARLRLGGVDFCASCGKGAAAPGARCPACGTRIPLRARRRT